MLVVRQSTQSRNCHKTGVWSAGPVWTDGNQMSIGQQSQALQNGAKARKATGAQLSNQRGDGANRQPHAAGDHIAGPDNSSHAHRTRCADNCKRDLESPAFEASERRKRFLRYVVDEFLAGCADRLKGYAIAIDVFGRDESFIRRATRSCAWRPAGCAARSSITI